jgi:hypothetical protein
MEFDPNVTYYSDYARFWVYTPLERNPPPRVRCEPTVKLK